MNSKFAKSLIGALVLVGAGFLAAPGAGAVSTQGKLGVGIVILDSCRLDPAGAGLLASKVGFGLKCSKGTDYTLEVSGSAAGQPDSIAQSGASVTVRF